MRNSMYRTGQNQAKWIGHTSAYATLLQKEGGTADSPIMDEPLPSANSHRIRFAPLPDPGRSVPVTDDSEELPLPPNTHGSCISRHRKHRRNCGGRGGRRRREREGWVRQQLEALETELVTGEELEREEQGTPDTPTMDKPLPSANSGRIHFTPPRRSFLYTPVLASTSSRSSSFLPHSTSPLLPGSPMASVSDSGSESDDDEEEQRRSGPSGPSGGETAKAKGSKELVS
ncbi:hypothetical protein B0H19DRAFT_1173418 [Mycena capillaripes]|nr:hypothetical protein B0H19DRAFT_1173418 [Mycena capillaripes]